MPLRQGVILLILICLAILFCCIHEATAEQDNFTPVLSTKPIYMQGRLRPAALASMHQHRCVRLSSQAPLCHLIRCKPLQCLLLGSGMLLKLSQLTESLAEPPEGCFSVQVMHSELPCDQEAPPCGATCGKMLLCGQHHCQERCHTGPCPATCRLLVDKSCACGLTQRRMPCSQPLRRAACDRTASTLVGPEDLHNSPKAARTQMGGLVITE